MENTKVKAFGTLQDIEINSPDIMMHWNAAIAKEIAPENQMSPGRTARERWKLFKNITKLGLQKSNFVEEEPDVRKVLMIFWSYKLITASATVNAVVQKAL